MKDWFGIAEDCFACRASLCRHCSNTVRATLRGAGRICKDCDQDGSSSFGGDRQVIDVSGEVVGSYLVGDTIGHIKRGIQLFREIPVRLIGLHSKCYTKRYKNRAAATEDDDYLIMTVNPVMSYVEEVQRVISVMRQSTTEFEETGAVRQLYKARKLLQAYFGADWHELMECSAGPSFWPKLRSRDLDGLIGNDNSGPSGFHSRLESSIKESIESGHEIRAFWSIERWFKKFKLESECDLPYYVRKDLQGCGMLKEKD